MWQLHDAKTFRNQKKENPAVTTFPLTKLFLTPIAVQVNPQFAANVVLHTGVFLIVKSI